MTSTGEDFSVQHFEMNLCKMRILERGLAHLRSDVWGVFPEDYECPYIWDLLGLLYEALDSLPPDLLLKVDNMTGLAFTDQIDHFCCIPHPASRLRLVYSRDKGGTP
jgi:hypothetical protein